MKKQTLISLLLVSLCCLSAHSQATRNPLAAVAEYNLMADGTFATGDKLAPQGAYFKWADLPNVTVPAGYHIPTQEELLVISGIYPPDQTSKSPYPDLSYRIDRTGEETVTLDGTTMTLNAHYYGTGDYACYALRFMGGDNKYLSAYRWEPVFTDDDTNQTKIKGLKVTCRLLGAAGAGLDVKELAKSDYWTTGNQADVVRYFPASGYGNYTDDGTVMDVNSRGRYWSTTPRNETATGAWGFGFDADFVMVYPWVATSRYCLRCFKDYTAVPDTTVTDAPIALEFDKENLDVYMTMTGPATAQVDFGDGQRTTVDLTQSQGVIAGTVKGSKLAVYAQGVTGFKATSQKIKTAKIASMPMLEDLQLGFNKISEISLGDMPKLTTLNLVNNRITAIDLSKCPKLHYVSLGKNYGLAQLKLDGLSQLTDLHVGSTQLTSLDLTPTPNLAVLDVASAKGIASLDLSKVPGLVELFASQTNLAQLDITHNPQLRRINLAGSSSLTSITFSSLKALQGCFLSKTALPKAQLDALLAALPDVNNLAVLAEERLWKKQLEVADIPDVKAQLVDLSGAKAKGWKIDEYNEAWSVAPASPCLAMTTGIPVGDQIAFKVENYYDPFWVDWGNWWSSFVQAKPYTVKHAVRQSDIAYYSRGLMTLDCSGQQLTRLSLPDNDQTYSVDASGNELTEFSIAPVNSLVTIDLRNNKLDAETLNAVFANLRNLADIVYPFKTASQDNFPESENYGKIFIEGNPGASSCNVAAATAKGYVVDVVPSAVTQVSSHAQLRIAYNPATGTVDIAGLEAGQPVDIYNMWGGNVLHAQTTASTATQHIDVTGLAPGVYIVTAAGRSLKLALK